MKKIILNVIALGFLLATGCSKSDSCAWGTSIVSGKTFKPSKVIRASDNVDITSETFSSDPCSKNTVTFTATTVLETSATGCTGTSNSSQTYSATTVSGVNTLNVSGASVPITSFDCNSFTLAGELNSGTSARITYSKQ